MNVNFVNVMKTYVPSNCDIHGEGDESNPDVDSDQDLNWIKEVGDVSNLNEKELKILIKFIWSESY